MVMFGSFWHCTRESILHDLQFAVLSEKSPYCKKGNNSNRALNELLRWLLCSKSCSQAFYESYRLQKCIAQVQESWVIWSEQA